MYDTSDIRKGLKIMVDGEWADLPRALLADGVGAVDDLVHAPAAGVDDDRGPVALLGRHRREVDTGSIDRLGRRGDAEMDEPAHPPGHLAIHGQERVEALDLRRDLHVVAGRVEARDRAPAGHARE